MNKDPFSIFSGQAHSKPKKSDPAAPSTPKNGKSVPEKTDVPPKEQDNEISQMIEKMRNMHDDLARKLDDTYQKTGLTPKYIDSFLANPNNFDNKQWEKIQQRRQELMRTIGTKINDASEGLASPINVQQKKESGITTEKERKSKTIGARRNWIQMR